jgi:hypothetical protein
MFKAKEVTLISGQALFRRLAKAESMYTLSTPFTTPACAILISRAAFVTFLKVLLSPLETNTIHHHRFVVKSGRLSAFKVAAYGNNTVITLL